MKTSTFVTLFLCLFVTVAIADPGDTLWTRTYGGSLMDQGFFVQQTTDGGYVLVGMTQSFGGGGTDVYMVKTDVTGDTLWTRAYGDTLGEHGRCVQQTADGGYVVAGMTQSFGAGSDDFYLLKTDADGDTLWTRTYGGSESDIGYSVRQTSDGGYIMTGNTYSSGAGHSDVYLVKTDADGDTLWTRTYGGSEWDDARSIQQTSDSGYVVAGFTNSFGAGSYDIWLLKTDTNGDTLWSGVYGGSGEDQGYSVQQTTDGGYIIAGYTYSFGAGSADVYLVKTDADGAAVWTRTYGGSSIDKGYSVEHTSDGGYIVAGSFASFGGGRYPDLYVVKTDENGDSLWTRRYGSSFPVDDGECVQQTTDGGYIVTGYTASFGAGGHDVWLLRLAGEAPEPDIAIGMIPDITPPIVLPAGSNFVYEGTLTNNTDEDLYTDVWIKVCYIPNGTYHGPYKTYYDLLVPANSTRNYYPVRQHIYAYAAPADYYYIAYCGEWPENNITDSTFFMVTVTPGDGNAGDQGWEVYGWGGADTPEIPAAFVLHGNYPNPFNAETNIGFDIPADAYVSLEVYNLLGQKVATLVDGNMPAGHHSVTWDASTASSGIYFYKLTTADFTETKRMTLLK
jgi:hypothetical protein